MSEGPQPLIDAELAARVVDRALQKGGDFAEVFCEERAGFGLAVDESRVERVQRGAERGAGVRVVDGETTYFAHVDGLGEEDLDRAADAVAAAARGERTEPQALEAAEAARPQEIATPPADVPAERKAELLRACDETARSAGDQIAQVMASYAEGRRVVTVANSSGRFTADERTRVRLGVQVVARRTAGGPGGGGGGAGGAAPPGGGRGGVGGAGGARGGGGGGGGGGRGPGRPRRRGRPPAGGGGPGAGRGDATGTGTRRTAARWR